MGGEWEKVKGPNTRSKGSKTSENADKKPRKSNIPESTKTRKPLREKNQQQSGGNGSTVKGNKEQVQKTLEDCSRAIGSAKELQKDIDGFYERNRDRPNIWLNELVKLIVSKCTIQDKFVPKNQYLQDSYIELDKSVEKVLANALKDNPDKYVKPHTRSTLYHETILTMSEDSARNKPTAGYRVILQVLAKHYPDDSQKSISDRLYFNASTACLISLPRDLQSLWLQAVPP